MIFIDCSVETFRGVVETTVLPHSSCKAIPYRSGYDEADNVIETHEHKGNSKSRDLVIPRCRENLLMKQAAGVESVEALVLE